MNITAYTEETRKELVMIEKLALQLEEEIASARFDLDQLAYANAKGYCTTCNTNHVLAAQKKIARAMTSFRQIEKIMGDTNDENKRSDTSIQRSIA